MVLIYMWTKLIYNVNFSKIEVIYDDHVEITMLFNSSKLFEIFKSLFTDQLKHSYERATHQLKQ
jgi:hypothetical protein